MSGVPQVRPTQTAYPIPEETRARVAPPRADFAVDGASTNPFDRAAPAPERFDYDGFVVANTLPAAAAALTGYVMTEGAVAARRKVEQIRRSVAAYAEAYAGCGDVKRDRRAEAGRELVAHLDEVIGELERMDEAVTARFVERGVAFMTETIAATRGKIADARERYGLVETHVRAPKSVRQTSYAMADVADTRDLTRAAGRLAVLRDEVMKARADVAGVERSERPGNWGAGPPSRLTKAQAESRCVTAEAAYAEALKAEMKAHPVLAAFQSVGDAEALEVLAAGPSPEAARVLCESVDRVERHLDTVEDRLAEDPSIVLAMPRVVAATKAAMSNASPLELRMIDDAAVAVEHDKIVTDLAIAALSVALGIVAAIPSGGTSFVIASAAVAAVDVVDLVRETDAYLTQAAFAGAAFGEEDAFADPASSKSALLALGGALISAYGALKGMTSFARALRADPALARVARGLIGELSIREVQALHASLGGEALKNLAESMSGREIRALVEAHGAEHVRRFAEVLPAEEATRLLGRLGPAALEAFTDVDPRLVELAVRDLGEANVGVLAKHLGGEAVVRIHQRVGDALRSSAVTFVDGHVCLDDLVRVRAEDFARLANETPEALRALAAVTRRLEANGGLANATLADLLDLARVCEGAKIALPDGLAPIARQRLAVALRNANKTKGAAGDALAREVLAQGERLGAFGAKGGPLPANAVVVDSQLLIAREVFEAKSYAALNSADRASVDFLSKTDPDSVHVAATTYLEVGSTKHPSFSMSVARDSAEYRAMVDELSKARVGAPKGCADRTIVADLLFAEVEGGGPATFVVQDPDVFARLARKYGVGVDLSDSSRTALQAKYREGFFIEVRGRRLRVVPVAS